MADQRISQLTKLAQGDVAANDVLAIVDVGASTTKKVEAKDLFQAGANLADSASIDLIKLNQASATKLGTTALADDAVTAAKLGDDSSIAYDSVAPSTNNFEGRGYVNSTSKNLQVWDGSAFQQVVAPTAGIENLAVTTGKLAANAVTTAKVDAAGLAAAALATDSVITAKIQDGACTESKLGSSSVTEVKLATGAVTENKIGTSAVTYTKIQNVSATDKLLGRSTAGAGNVEEITCTAAGRALLDDADATAQRTTLGLGTLATQSATVTGTHSGTSSGTNTGDQTITLTGDVTGTGTGSFAATITPGAVTESAIATNAITNGKVLDGAITATKLAADSTTIVQAGTPAGSGAYEGQLWFDTNTSVKYVWNGSAWIRQAALNVINFSDTTPLNFAVAYPDNHTANITTTLDTQDANAVFIGPASGADAAPTFRALTPADLPNATASAKGIVQPGTGLAVNAGVLNHSNSVTAGTYTRLVVDAQGHISQGQLLEASDIPSLDAAKITTGGLPTDRLADAAVTIDKMADYSTASIGTEFPAATFTGQLHLNSLDRSFYMWDGNVWVPIGISAGEIVFAGTFDASDPANRGKVASVTPEGAAVGLTVGSALPASSLANNRYYLVVSKGGTLNTGDAPHVTLAPPDIILSVYSTTSPAWVEIDVSSGAGAIAASQVSFAATGDIAAINVQSAIEEVSTECRNATNITSGTLAVARGGTNVASYTKGDLLAASASTTLTKLPVGTNGQVLRANSATATGLEYGADFVGTVTTVTSSTAALTVATATTTPALTVRAATTSVDGIVQLSDSTGTTSSVLAATPTAVKSAYDLAALALPKAGGTVTGELLIGNAGSLVFEGSTNDGNETTLTVADPTADRTITLPNITGTVLTTAGDTMTGVLSISAGTAALPGLAIASDANTGIYSPGADQLAFSTGGAQRLLIDSSGTVNVQGPGQKILNQGGSSFLEIGTGTATNQSAYIDLTTDTTYTDYGLRLIREGGGANTASQLAQRGTGELSLRCLEAAPLTFYTTNTERARIDSSGNVGIGTSAPGTYLDTRGFASYRGNAYAIASFAANNTLAPLNICQSENGTHPAISAGQNSSGVYQTLVLMTSEQKRVVIEAAGNVGIGTTSPSELLHVAGNARIGTNDTSVAELQIGVGATGNRMALIDLVGDTTYNDFGLRILRDSTGANANSQIQHRGTGELRLIANEASPLVFWTTSTERARIDSSGRLLVGTSTARTNLYGSTFNPSIQIEAAGLSGNLKSILSICNNSTIGASPTLALISSGANSIGAVTVVANGAGLGEIDFLGTDGTKPIAGASISAEVDGTPGTDDMPGRLVFSTTADGANSPTERMRITQAGNVGIGASGPGTSLDVQKPAASATIGNIRVAPTSTGQARYHLYNGSATAEWLFGQKTSTDHDFKLSKSVAGSEADYVAIKTSGIINIAVPPTYADNAAATSGGLVAGDIYRKSDGTLMIRY